MLAGLKHHRRQKASHPPIINKATGKGIVQWQAELASWLTCRYLRAASCFISAAPKGFRA